MPQPYSNVVAYHFTAIADTLFRVINTELWLSNANIHIVTKDAKYGNVGEQLATAYVGDVLVYEKFNLADLYFKNAVAGQNTTIYVVGITMSKQDIIALGV